MQFVKPFINSVNFSYTVLGSAVSVLVYFSLSSRSSPSPSHQRSPTSRQYQVLQYERTNCRQTWNFCCCSQSHRNICYRSVSYRNVCYRSRSNRCVFAAPSLRMERFLPLLTPYERLPSPLTF